MSTSLRFLFGALLLAALGGCASVPMASTELDTQAKSFATTPGKANIYIYRHESFGAAIRIPVSVDGRKVASTASKTYLMVAVEPGRHEVLSDAEVEDKLMLDVQAGRNYFVWQEIKMGGFSARTKLQQVDEAKARKDMAKCKRVQQTM